jgi:prevent-host-death family protein
MVEMSVKEARSKLSTLLKRVEGGDEIVILRRGKKVARLVPSHGQERRLPNLKDFRASIRIKGDSLSGAVLAERKGTRY